MIPCLNPVTANVPDVEAFLKLAAGGGFKGADHGANAWADWVARTSLDHVREVCAEQGCVIGHGGLPVNFREDDASFEMGLAALPAMAEVMQALCTRGMCTWIGPTVKSDPAAWRKVLVARLTKVAEVLKDHGLQLGLEFVAPKTSRREGTPFVYNMPGMLELCGEIDETCGLLLDSYHWYTSHATLDDLLALEASQIVHVHINDAHPGPIDGLMDLDRRLPGEGVIDLDGFLKALKTIGYEGPVAVETFSEALRQMTPEAAAKMAGDAVNEVMRDYV